MTDRNQTPLRNRTGFLSLVAAMIAGVGALTATAGADSAVLGFNPAQGSVNFYNNNSAFGWEFTVNDDDLIVTHLGHWDYQEDGLSQPRPVGIFDSDTGALVVSTFVQAGTGPDLIDGFRWADTAPTLLTAGTSYVVATYLSSGGSQDRTIGFYEDFQDGFASVVFNPAITYGEGRWLHSAGGLVMPTSNIPGYDFVEFGPSFQFQIVPAPGALALLGLAGFCGLSRRRSAN